MSGGFGETPTPPHPDAPPPRAQRAPPPAGEWPEFLQAMSGGFGEPPTPPYLDAPPPVAELDRSLALRDNGRIVATAGIYSRSLTIPGAVVPCAGVTWVTVAPTH